MPHNKATAPIRETGSDSVGMTVATKRRKNKKITNTTNAIVPISVSDTSCKASRTDSERSLTEVILTDWGICSLSRGSASLTASTTRTVLAPGWRKIASVIDGSPFKLACERVVSILSSTVATSFRRTVLPLRLATISSANSWALRSCLLACSVSNCLGPSSVPTGVLTLAERRATDSSSILMLRAANASGSTRTRTANRLEPKMLTWATPLIVDSVGEIKCSA